MYKETRNGIIVIGVLVGTGLGVWAWTKAGAAPPTVCTPGDEKCIGLNWCRCNPMGTKWDIITPNAAECAVAPGTATLYGTVTDAKTGSPVEGISVSCNGYTDTTLPDGTYRITNIPPGTYAITFTDPLGIYETEVR